MKCPYLHQSTNGKPRIKVLVDADVLLELFINRSPFVEEAEELLDLAVDAEAFDFLEVYVTDKCLRRIRFELGESDSDLGEKAVTYLETKLKVKSITIDKNFREQARACSLRDFDSAEEVVCANAMNLDAIITLNPQNFDENIFPIWSVQDLLKRIQLEKDFKKQYTHLVARWTSKVIIPYQTYNQSRNERSSKFPDQVVEAILAGKYSWACVLILCFNGYNPLHYIPYRTYYRLLKEENSNSLNASFNVKDFIHTEQFNQVVETIRVGKYSWACVLILRFNGCNPLHYIPYRTYNRLLKENSLMSRMPK